MATLKDLKAAVSKAYQEYLEAYAYGSKAEVQLKLQRWQQVKKSLETYQEKHT